MPASRVRAVTGTMAPRRSPGEIADEIEAAIRAGDPRYATQLPPQRDLAEHYRVGRTTVVSAFELLADRGLIERQRGGAARIRPRARWRRTR